MGIEKAIKELRLRRKIPQNILAKKIGITQGYLSLIEKGLREPGFDLIKKIADVFKVPQQLIFLLACDLDPKFKRFAKSIKKITLLADDILKST